MGHLLLWPEVGRYRTARKYKGKEMNMEYEKRRKIAAGNFVIAASPLKCVLFLWALVLQKVT